MSRWGAASPRPAPSPISGSRHRVQWEVEQGLAGAPPLSDKGGDDNNGEGRKRPSVREAVRLNEKEMH